MPIGVGWYGNTFSCIHAKISIYWEIFDRTLFKIKFATTFPQYVL